MNFFTCHRLLVVIPDVNFLKPQRMRNPAVSVQGSDIGTFLLLYLKGEAEFKGLKLGIVIFKNLNLIHIS